jgi:hypothetical protein
MTVQQLIKQLSKMPHDAQVIYYDGDNGATTVESAMHEDGIVTNPYSREPQLEPANVVVLYAF